MSDKLILRLSNEMGNQMFMYASAYSISKELNRRLYIDDETAFLSKLSMNCRPYFIMLLIRRQEHFL